MKVRPLFALCLSIAIVGLAVNTELTRTSNQRSLDKLESGAPSVVPVAQKPIGEIDKLFHQAQTFSPAPTPVRVRLPVRRKILPAAPATTDFKAVPAAMPAAVKDKPAAAKIAAVRRSVRRRVVAARPQVSRRLVAQTPKTAPVTRKQAYAAPASSYQPLFEEPVTELASAKAPPRPSFKNKISSWFKRVRQKLSRTGD